MKWLKKCGIGILGLIVSATYLVTLSTNLFAQQKTVSNTAAENAATYYSRAIELSKYPEFSTGTEKDINWKLRKLVEDGGKKEDKELLERVLRKNEPCFNEMKGIMDVG